MRVSVIGGGTLTDAEAEQAEEVGRLLGERGHTVVCGGLGGVMEAACRGASEAGGRTVGILPGEDRRAANPHVDVPIATGLGHARNGLVVLNGDVRKSQRDFRANQKSPISDDAAIAIDGGPGTLSEIGFAGVFDRPTAGLGTHDAPGVEPVDSPADAVAFVESAVGDDAEFRKG